MMQENCDGERGTMRCVSIKYDTESSPGRNPSEPSCNIFQHAGPFPVQRAQSYFLQYREHQPVGQLVRDTAGVMQVCPFLPSSPPSAPLPFSPAALHIGSLTLSPLVPPCHVTHFQQEFTQSGGVRPFGLSLLVAGYDDNGPQLFQVGREGGLEPSD